MQPPASASRRYAWISSGDISAFLGLTFDNVAQLIVFSGLLIGVFRFPAQLVLGRMLPGTALGVLFGDLIYTWLAFRLARRTGRDDVTAMPLGIDTVSLFGLTFGVLGPIALSTGDPERAFRAGMALMVVMGLFKIAASFAAGRLLRVLPPAALLGTIGGVGLLLIAFFPLTKLIAVPLVGLPALFFCLLALLRGIRLPGGVPAVLVGVVGSAALYYALSASGGGFIPHEALHDAAGLDLGLRIPWPNLGFASGLRDALPYLPVALPLALVTVIGGIDNTASAAAVGDDYGTRDILLTEGVSTLLAGLCGGVIQTTPYIGHPAYKRMGGRAGYTLATALFVGFGGIFGYLAFLVHALPEVVVAPILIFIGLEITAQAFRGVPGRHAPAVAACCLPVAADLAFILANQLLGPTAGALQGEARAAYQGLMLLANGFVFSSLLLGATTAFLLDGRLFAAAGVLGAAAGAAFFGLIHSPLPGGALIWPGPWVLPAGQRIISYGAAGGYALSALLLLLLRFLPRQEADAEDLTAH